MAARFAAPDNPLSQAGNKVGIAFNPSRRLIPTLRPHVIMEHVNKVHGVDKGNELMKVLFRKYFEEAIDVSVPSHLLDACAEVFGPELRESFTVALGDEAIASSVKAKDQFAKSRLRVSGVPFFIIGDNSFSGAQPPELLAEVLREAAAN